MLYNVYAETLNERKINILGIRQLNQSVYSSIIKWSYSLYFSFKTSLQSFDKPRNFRIVFTISLYNSGFILDSYFVNLE